MAVGQFNQGSSYLLRVTEDGRNNCTAALPTVMVALGGGFMNADYMEDPNINVFPVSSHPEFLANASDQIVCPHLFVKQSTQQPASGVSDTPMALSIAPNPVIQGQSLRLQIDNPAQQLLTILVTNTLGQTVFRSRLRSTAAQSTIQIPTNSWSAGMYNVAILRDDQTIKTTSFVVSY